MIYRICIWLLFVLSLGFIRSNAQGHSIHSKKELDSEWHDTTKIDKLNEWALSLLGTNPAEAILYAQKGLALSQNISDKKREALLTKAVGLGYFYRGEYLETLEYWEQALSLYGEINNSSGVANLLSNIGSVYESSGDQTKALDYHLRSLRIGEENNDSVRIATATQNIGVVYSNLNEYEESLKFYNQSLEFL